MILLRQVKFSLYGTGLALRLMENDERIISSGGCCMLTQMQMLFSLLSPLVLRFFKYTIQLQLVPHGRQPLH